MTQHNKLPDQLEFWDNYYTKKEMPPNNDAPFPLAEYVLPLLEDRHATPILDLACGLCNDAIYFAEQHFEVYAVDFSQVVLEKARQIIAKKGKISSLIRLYERDICEPLPFDDGKFGAVYSHLGLHYFDDRTTRSIFSETYRVLRRNGLLAFNVKSVHDFRYGAGIELGPDIYDYKSHIRHFFSTQYVEELLKNWKVLLIEEYDEVYGDASMRSSFIRAVAAKP